MSKSPSKFLKLSKARKTVYEFDDKKVVTDADLRYILEAAQWSPSCGNLQPWYFIIVRNKRMIEDLVSSTYYVHFPFINPNPPLVIAVVLRLDCKDSKLPQTPTCATSYSQHSSDMQICLGMATLSACLAAADLGIGSSILTPKIKEASSLLKIKGKNEVRLLLGVGYEKKGAFQKQRERNPLKEIVFDESFRVKSRLWQK